MSFFLKKNDPQFVKAVGPTCLAHLHGSVLIYMCICIKQDSYFKRRGLAKAWDHGSEDKPTKLSDCSSLDILAEQIQRLKGPPVFKCIGRIQQCTRLHSSNMVSNIAFSKETDIFCTAGISRRVRLYRYSRLVATSTEESAVSGFKQTF